MKSIINIIAVLLIIFSCKAQNTATLLQMEECRNRPNRASEGCPDLKDVIYVKDSDNRLDKFVGTWKGNFNGKVIELKLEKKEDFGNNDVKWDRLIGKIRVKDSQGNVIFDSFQNPENDANPYGYNFQRSVYEMRFNGKDECDDYGTVFIEIQSVPVNGTKMRLFYSRDGDVIDTTTCPTLLPEDWTELTKQKTL
jgi:hypothetical protein